MTAFDFPQLPVEVVDAALQAYAEQRWYYADIRHEATQIRLENEIREEAFNAALVVAYSLGYRAGYNQGRDDEGAGDNLPAWWWQLEAKPKVADPAEGEAGHDR